MNLKWEKGHVKSRLSTQALQGGKDADGALIYVGRALHKGIFLPAKVIPTKSACYVCYNGDEVLVENFEVLSNNNKFSWEPASDGKIATGAVSTGKDGNDEMYIGRVAFKGSMTIGKIHQSHRVLYFPFNGKEEKSANYEVLVYKQPKLQWIQTSSKSAVLRDAVLGGRDTDGAQIYVGRAHHAGDLIPCKVIPSKQIAYAPFNGDEVAVHNFEILVGSDVKWKKEKNGKIPSGAYPCGKTSKGETLYIGRVEHNQSITVGKVHQAHGCLYIPYSGKELAFKEYEVLTGN